MINSNSKIDLKLLKKVKISIKSDNWGTKIKFIKNTDYLLYLADIGSYEETKFRYDCELQIINYKTSEMIHKIKIDGYNDYTYFNCSNDGTVAGYMNFNKKKAVIIPDTTKPDEQFEIIIDTNQKITSEDEDEITYTQIAFSSDNKYLFVIEDSKEYTYQYDLKTRSLVNVIKETSFKSWSNNSMFIDLDYFEDKKSFLLLNYSAKLFNCESKELFKFEDNSILSYGLPIGGISKDHKKIATLTVTSLSFIDEQKEKPLVIIFDLESRKIVQKFYYDIEKDILCLGYANNFSAISYIYDDKLVIIGSSSDNIIYDAETGKEVYFFKDNGSECFTFSEENKLLAMKTEEDEITIFQVNYEE